MNANEFMLKSIRKLVFFTNRASIRVSNFSQKVDGKTTRMLSETNSSIRLSAVLPWEKIYYNGLPGARPVYPALPAIGAKPNVTLFVPSLDNGSFFGGAATALIVAIKTAIKTKRPLHIVQTSRTGKVHSLNDFFASENIESSNVNIEITSIADRKYNTPLHIPMHPKDIFIASFSWDAQIINQLPIEKFIYLVQDFEPIFYNNSDSYILAEETYNSKKIIPLCNTKLMFDFMLDRGYPMFQKNTAFFFEPAVSRINSGKLIEKSANEKKRIFLYGRPGVSRNLFYTSLEAINLAIENNSISSNDYDLFMAGQDDIPNIALSSGLVIKNLGKMGMSEYVQFSKTVDIAIAPMMAPHPNYPTLEFASIGSAVVTTKYANKQSLENYSKNIFMSELNAESMAKAINAATKKTYFNKITDIATNNINDNWDNSLDLVISNVLKLL